MKTIRRKASPFTSVALPALSALCVLCAAACTDLRDLHDTTGAVLHIEGSWHHSLGRPVMHNATVMLHHEDGITRNREYLSRPNGTTVDISRGEWDVMVFNGIMESEDATNLDHVFFRGTDRLSTFEAYALRVAPSRRLARGDDEYVASNNMEIFTFSHHRVSVDHDSGVYVKYRNGVNTGSAGDPHDTGTLETTPRAMSFNFRVLMTGIINPASTRSASGALRGFMGSVFMPPEGGRPRPGITATHHVTLSQPSGSRTRTDGDGTEHGMLVSQSFVTFGPPLPENEGEELPTSGRYFFEPVFVLNDGEEFSPGEIDITSQVNKIIDRMLEHHGNGEDIGRDENLLEIFIDREVTLPVVDDGGDGPGGGGGGGGNGNGPNISVDPWEDEEVIIWVRG